MGKINLVNANSKRSNQKTEQADRTGQKTYLKRAAFKSVICILGVLCYAFSGNLACSAPTGEVVTSGNATISQSGDTTNINQPSVNSITLNRVIGTDKSVTDRKSQCKEYPIYGCSLCLVTQ